MDTFTLFISTIFKSPKAALFYFFRKNYSILNQLRQLQCVCQNSSQGCYGLMAQIEDMNVIIKFIRHYMKILNLMTIKIETQLRQQNTYFIAYDSIIVILLICHVFKFVIKKLYYTFKFYVLLPRSSFFYFHTGMTRLRLIILDYIMPIKLTKSDFKIVR